MVSINVQAYPESTIEMGLCASNPLSDLPPAFRNQLEDNKKLFDFLQINSNQSVKVAKLFWKFDDDGSNSLSLREFKRSLGVETSTFVDKILALVDSKGEGTLNFSQYVVAIWNICTLTEDSIGPVTFESYNESGRGVHTDTIFHLVDEAMGILSGTRVGIGGTKSIECDRIGGMNYSGQKAGIRLQSKEGKVLVKLADPDGCK